MNIDKDTQREALASFNFSQSYARYNPENKRRETWEEAVERVMNMHGVHLAQLGANTPEGALESIERAYKAKRILGSQRSLQFGGEAVLAKHPRAYNCTTAYVDTPKRFGEALYLLLCGAGVGYSVQSHHVGQLPPVRSLEELEAAPRVPFVIEDSIEGWARALDALVTAYMGQGDLPAFDGSLVRPKGSAIRSCGGKAPGPEPLLNMLREAENLLRSRAGQSLRPIDASDLMCISADCVRAGGVRRAALIALFDLTDDEMLTSKSAGNWWETHPWRARANISALALRHRAKEPEYAAAVGRVFEYTKSYGEPGIIWVNSLETAYNPCVAGDTLVLTDKGYRRIRDLKASTLILDPRFGKGSKGDTSERGGFMTAPSKQLYMLRTHEGYSVECTEDHEIMTQRGWVEARDLVAGDLIHVANARGVESFGDKYTQEQGLLLGWLLGDGCVVSPTQGRLYFYGAKRRLVSMFEQVTGCSAHVQEVYDRAYIDFPLSVLANIKDTWNTETKRVLPDAIYEGSGAFLSAFLRALFSADGSVQGDSSKGLSVRLTQAHLPLLQVVQRVLLQFGIFGKMYENRRPKGTAQLPDGKGGLAEYPVEAVHDLCISRDSLNVFAARVGFLCPKQDLLVERLGARTRTPYADRFVAQFESFEPTRIAPVYDLTQPDTSSFIANGVVVHNCVEIGMVPMLIKDEKGQVLTEYALDYMDFDQQDKWRARGLSYETGWQFCNLTEVNAAAFKDPHDAFEAVRLATHLGLIQAGYTLTDEDYLVAGGRTCTREILEREYLLGVSLTGLGSAPAWVREERFLEELGLVAGNTARMYWEAYALKRCPARVTCVKPSGNAAVLLGCASGVHADHAPRYLRRVQASGDSAITQAYMDANPKAAEKSVWSRNGNDYVLSFAIEAPAHALLKTEQTAQEFLEWVALVQRSWVREGTVRLTSAGPVRHNVSNTCVVHPHEWEGVIETLATRPYEFGGVSCLGASGDYDYPQAPFCRVYEPHEVSEDDPHRDAKLAAWELWNELRASHVPVDYSLVHEAEDNTEVMGEVACAGGACELKL
jgi:hypothetical protein